MVIHWNKPDNPFRSFSVLITVVVTYLETDAERGYWRSDRYAFAILLHCYEVKAQTHTCRTSMCSNIEPCPAIKFLKFDGLTSLT